MDKQIGNAILQLQTDKKARPICSVKQVQILGGPGSEGWLQVMLSTGTVITFSPETVDAIQRSIKVPGQVQYRAAKAGQ